MTITISNTEDYEYQPGDTDPVIASYLSNYAAKLSSLISSLEQSPKRKFLMDEARRLRDRSMDMMRGGHISWWFDLDIHDMSGSSSNEGELEDTANSPPSSTPDDKSSMTYQCDGTLGSPQATDCDQLAWSGLKSPSTIEVLNPETPNIYTFGSCALGVSSPIATQISWAHLLTAFETLNTLCVQNPIKSVKGGRAFYGTQSVNSWINGKRDSIAGVNGFDALPKGINATVWNHSDKKNVDLKCEWRLATEGKDITYCAETG